MGAPAQCNTDVEGVRIMAEDAKTNETQQQAEEHAAPAAQETAPTSAAEADEKESLRQALEKAQAEAKDYLDQLIRSRADYANYKRRAEQEKQELVRRGNANLIVQLLPVLDDFERAFQSLPSGLEKLTWLDGIALVYHKLQRILEKEGLQPIQVNGRKFDPTEHEAIGYEECDDLDDGMIVAEVQKGYKLGDRVLRPTLVRVARRRVQPAAEAQASAEGPSQAQGAETPQE